MDMSCREMQNKDCTKTFKRTGRKTYKFSKICNSVAERHNYPLDMTGNMDETLVNFDLSSNRIVNVKDEKTILSKTIGNKKRRFAVVLACMANGKKLQPMVTFI